MNQMNPVKPPKRNRTASLEKRHAQSRWLWLLHLQAAAGFAVAQPLFDVMGRHTEFAIAHRLGPVDFLVLAGLLSLSVGGILWLLVAGVSLIGPRAGSWCQSATMGLTLGTLPLALLSGKEADLAVRLVLWALAAILLAVVYSRYLLMRRFLTALALAALVFPALFLWRVLPQGASARAEARTPASALEQPELTLAEGARPPLVLVVLDELPMASLLVDDTALDAARFPHFAELAARSHWFRNATTVSQSTSAAVPAILTGQYPPGKKAPTAQEYPANLFALLEDHYALNVFERMTSLCGAACEEGEAEASSDASFAPARGARLRLALEDLAAVLLALRLPGLGPDVTEGWSGYWETAPVETVPEQAGKGSTNRWAWDQPPQRFARFLTRLEDSPRETLHYIHMSLPHVPWQYLPDGRRYRRERVGMIHGLERAGKWRSNEWEVTQAQQRHLLQLQYADRLLGELIDTLDRTGLFEGSLVVVTADHGAAFRPGDHRRIISSLNLADIAHVPLFVKMPGQTEGAPHAGNVELVDIVPTILNALGARGNFKLDGLDLLAAERASNSKTIFRNSFHGGSGKAVDFRMEDLAATSQAVAVKAGRFPEASLFRIGHDRHLVGRLVSEMRVLEPRGVATVGGAEALEAVRPKARTQPVHLMGQLVLEEPESSPQRLAVALEGVVQAVTETYGALPAERLEFSAMLDPAVLVGGRNQLAIYRISDPTTLTPLVVRQE